MRPITLKIKGLNSYIEEQVIDFEKLTERGLFGIFGPTGCGKSTILDGIAIALFGYKGIPRDTKDYINTAVEKLYLSYEFRLNQVGGSTNYLVERSIKRKGERSITTDFARLKITKENGESEVFDKVSDVDHKIVEAIGLNHYDFLRSVILPQGKFSDFLKLSGVERRNMLERILNLSKYGSALTDKIKKARGANDFERKGLEGELSTYGEITDEYKKELKASLEESEKEEKILKEAQAKLRAEKEDKGRIWQLQIDKSDQNSALEVLLKDEARIKELKGRHDKGKKILDIKPVFEQKQASVKAHEELKGKDAELSTELDKQKSQLEKVEESYERAYGEKEEKLPKLVKRESELLELKKLKAEIEEKITIRNALIKEYKVFKGKTDEGIAKRDSLKAQYDLVDKEILELTEGIKGLVVSPELRKELGEANVLQQKWNENSERLLVLEKKLTADKLELFDLHELRNKLEEQLEGKGKTLREYTEQHQKYKENVEEIEAEIKQLEKRISDKENKLQIYRNEFKRKEGLVAQLGKMIDSEKALNMRIGELGEAFKSIEDRLVARLRGALEEDGPCPVCGSKEHEIMVDQSLEDEKEESPKYSENEKKTIDEFLEIERELQFIDREKKRIDKEVQGLEGFNEAEMLVRETELKETIEEGEALKNNLRSALENLKAYEEKRDSERKAIGALEVDQAKNKEKCVSGDKDKKNTEIEIERIKTQLGEMELSLAKFKVAHDIKDIGEEVQRLTAKDQKHSQLTKALEEKQKAIKVIKEDIVKSEKSVNEAQIKLAETKERGSGLKEIIADGEGKIKAAIGDNDLEAELDRTVSDKNKIVQLEKELKDKQKLIKDQYQKTNTDLIKLKESMKSLDQRIKDETKMLKDLMEKSNIQSEEEISTFNFTEEQVKAMKVEVDQYNKSVEQIKLSLEKIEKGLDGQEVTKETWEEIQTKLEEAVEKIKEIHEKKGSLKERLDDVTKKLKEKKELEKKFKAMEKKADLLNELFNLTKGNRFVEYIAVHHLKYIALEASKRLMKITNQRYGLELDSRGNFIIADHFNGGVKRDTNSLSGGETFLTSLSLALALSSQIQLKGNTNLEFFFLDEGFGTLDTHLLDAVMTSLESLHTEKLSVGIISHVEELKNRVPVRLVVTPAEPGLKGTEVKVELA